jgi:AAHS family 3-hydroxyphenylpropionic acid transporter
MLFNIGGGIGAVAIATIMDRFGRRGTVIGMYIGIVVALTVLASAGGANSTAVGGLLCGFFIVGGQSVLYALAGHAYPTEVRGTGVGAAVAVGRLGSILGPLVAGQLFALGQSPSMLVGSSIPLVVIAALAALSVVGAFRQRSALGAQGA